MTTQCLTGKSAGVQYFEEREREGPVGLARRGYAATAENLAVALKRYGEEFEKGLNPEAVRALGPVEGRKLITQWMKDAEIVRKSDAIFTEKGERLKDEFDFYWGMVQRFDSMWEKDAQGRYQVRNKDVLRNANGYMANYEFPDSYLNPNRVKAPAEVPVGRNERISQLIRQANDTVEKDPVAAVLHEQGRMDEWRLIRDRKMDEKTYRALTKEFGIVRKIV